MALIHSPQGDYVLDDKICEALDKGWGRIERNMDFWALFTGKEGSGKTTLMSQCFEYLAQKQKKHLELSSFTFSGESFLANLGDPNRPKRKQTCYDEAITGQNRKRAMSRLNTDIDCMMTRIRYKNPQVALCIPSIYRLTDHVVERLHLWIHVKELTDGKRVFYLYSGMHKVNWIETYYRRGLHGDMKHTIPGRIHGTFSAAFPVDQDEYNTLKDKSFASNDKVDLIRRNQREYIKKLTGMLFDTGKSYRNIAKELQIDHTTLLQMIGRKV